MNKYIYYDNMLLYETRGTSYIEYLYDESGSPIGINYYDGTTLNEYYFVNNLQGDVTAIRDWNGNLIATYIYDAWGNLLSLTDGNGAVITDTTHIGYINPIRYRGYYYDVETGLYYLQSRYYDAKICRFINADNQLSTSSLDGTNLFAYCVNNPILFVDYNGNCHGYPNNPNLNSPNSGVRYGYACGSYGIHVRRPGKEINQSSTGVVKNAISDHDANRRPNTGEPGSTFVAPNGDTRTYGEDGKPSHDYDHDDHGQPSKHPHDSNGGHNHDWANGERGPAYSTSWEPIAGVTLATACILGIVVIAADDATGVGVADDFLFGPLGAGVAKGFVLIFG